MARNPLFSKYDVHALVTQSLEERVKKEVDSLKSDEILRANEGELLEYVYGRMEMTIPTLDEDAIHYDEREVQVDARRFANNRMFFDSNRPYYVTGTRVRVLIPFDGDANVFHIRPSLGSSSGYPIGETLKNEIVLTYEQEIPDGTAVKQSYLSALAEINKYLANIEGHFAGFNKQIRPIIEQQIKQRKEKLIASASIGDALGLPQKGGNVEPATYSVSLKKRERPKINLPATTTTGKAEPVLSQSDYEYVLSVMKLMTESMERTPKTFALMDEEAIRDVFLVHINGQYNGMASGESFNFGGKTDILLNVSGRCVFIAECKFWTGEKGLLATIDQLLGYLSWRDTKTALVILNRNKKFTGVLETIATSVPTHPNFIRDDGMDGETVFKYLFHQPLDPNRHLQLTLMCFDVPT